MKLEIDPEFEALIPALTEEETADLTASLKRDGCRDAIVVWKGFVVDGHNRYRICTENKIPFKTWEIPLGERSNVKEWMIRNQLSRRNLNAYQRSLLALGLEEIYKERAKQNQRDAGGDKRSQAYRESKESKKCVEDVKAVDSRIASSKAMNVSTKTIGMVKVIEAKADDDLKKSIKNGIETVAGAYKRVTGKVPESSGDKAVDRARVRVPELIRNLKLQLGNLGLGGRFDEPLDQIVEAAR